MNSEVVSKIDDYIQTIADSLGVAAEHVWLALVHQQILEGSMSIFWVAASGMIMFLLGRSVFNVFHKGRYCKEDTIWDKMYNMNFFKEGFFVIPLAIAYLLLFILFGVNIDNVLKLFNPEYYAIQEILSVFK